MAAARQYRLDRTLDVDQRLRATVQRGHVLVLRLERHGVQPRVRRRLGRLVQPGLARGDDERALGRVAVDAPGASILAQHGVVAEQAGAQQLVERRRQHRQRLAGARDLALRRIAHAADLGVDAAGPQPLHGHLVARQGAGLVRADHRRAAQRLDGRQVADDRVAPGHAVHADGQRDRQHDDQPLGDHGHRQRDRGEEHVDQRLAVHEAADREGHGRERQDGPHQPVAEARDAPRQRRGQHVGLGQQLRDAPDLGRAAGGDDDAGGRAVVHQGRRVRHVGAVGEHGVGRQRVGALLDRQRLAGQRGLGHAQLAHLEQPQVGRHLVARSQQDDVSGHQLARVDALALPAAQHGGLGGQRARQRLERTQRLALLDEADHRVEEDHAEDHRRIGIRADRQLDDGGHQQDVDQHLVKLQQEAQHRAAPLGRRQRVVTVALAALDDRFGVKPGAGRSRQRLQQRRRGLGMPGWGVGGVHAGGDRQALQRQPGTAAAAPPA